MQNENRRLVLVQENVSTIKSAILEANIVIRMAIIAPTVSEQNIELLKILATRSAADLAYKELEKYYGKQPILLDIIEHRNNAYRNSQTALIKRLNTDKENYWAHLQEYSKQYTIYVLKINSLLKSIDEALASQYYSIRLVLYCGLCIIICILIALGVKYITQKDMEVINDSRDDSIS
jgi:hypothetical protein